jgi:tRNA G18 (ribose-2'-O)-methylase SpoU
MPFISVVDPTDIALADYRNIPDPELIQRRGLFVAEGRLVVRRLLTESALKTRSVIVTEPARAALDDVLQARQDLPIYVVPPAVMNGITGFNLHRGCLAIGERPQPSSWRDVAAGSRTLVTLERVANADNVGGIFRNVAAFGGDAVLLDETTTDPLYRKAIRTSMGAALVVPFARADPWPAVLQELRALGFATVALTPAPQVHTVRESLEPLRSRPLVLVLGHEGEGLTAAALGACEFRARIPVASTVDSLNVAAAAAIALYELRRS